MRKLIVLSFISLDGVMQAPGGQQEDKSGGFEYGGWTFPYFDEFSGKIMGEQMGHPYDLLLGRKTYEIFASYWPKSKDPMAKDLNEAKKFVASRTLRKLGWQNSVLLGENIVPAIRILKESEGPQLQVHGSGNLVQTLLKNDLVDELWLKIFPLTLGKGKRLFGSGTVPASFKLVSSRTSPSGVIFADYKLAGSGIETGNF